MRHRLFVHVVWTTRGREPIINAGVAADLTDHLARIASEERAHVIEIGIVATHLHLLLRIHPVTSIPRLLQRMKGGSARATSRSGHSIRWASGYNIQSVSMQALELVAAYVRDQHLHHPKEAIPGWPTRD